MKLIKYSRRTLLLFFIFSFALVLGAPETLEISPAIALTLGTTPQRAYQLESSTDLAKWEASGGSLVGDGRAIKQFEAAGDSRKYYRVVANDVRDLSSLLEPIRKANNVPALACAVIRSNRLVGIGVTGLRKWDVTNAPVELTDHWHHGSLTKSMTATLAAIMVAKGEIRWESTLAEIFPELAPKMHAQWRGATLEQLTSNRGGAPNDLSPSGIWLQLVTFGGTPRLGRHLLLEKLTAIAPSSPPGTKYEYSNAGFSLGGGKLLGNTGTAKRPSKSAVNSSSFGSFSLESETGFADFSALFRDLTAIIFIILLTSFGGRRWRKLFHQARFVRGWRVPFDSVYVDFHAVYQ